MRLLHYYSSDKTVATVTADGVIRGVGKGSCKIYVVSSHGAAVTVKVTVR